MFDLNPASVVAYAAIKGTPSAPTFYFNQGFLPTMPAAGPAGIYTLTLAPGHFVPGAQIAIVVSIMNSGGSLSFANTDYDPATGIITVFTRIPAGSTDKDVAILVLRALNP